MLVALTELSLGTDPGCIPGLHGAAAHPPGGRARGAEGAGDPPAGAAPRQREGGCLSRALGCPYPALGDPIPLGTFSPSPWGPSRSQHLEAGPQGPTPHHLGDTHGTTTWGPPFPILGNSLQGIEDTVPKSWGTQIPGLGDLHASSLVPQLLGVLMSSPTGDVDQQPLMSRCCAHPCATPGGAAGR